jgi:hypothetical protein
MFNFQYRRKRRRRKRRRRRKKRRRVGQNCRDEFECGFMMVWTPLKETLQATKWKELCLSLLRSTRSCPKGEMTGFSLLKPRPWPVSEGQEFCGRQEGAQAMGRHRFPRDRDGGGGLCWHKPITCSQGLIYSG